MFEPEFPEEGEVALLAEGVDRNMYTRVFVHVNIVALLAEGVDRNRYTLSISASFGGVALLAEGVDRNLSVSVTSLPSPGRPPRGGRG